MKYKIADWIDTEQIITHSIQCDFCGQDYATRDITVKAFAKDLQDDGWRIKVRDKHNIIGVACPECIRTEEY